MRINDKYVHFKGGEYIFKCIALPLSETHIVEIDTSVFYNVATHEGTMKDVRLFDFLGITLTDAHEPLVIYQSTKDYFMLKYWARPVDDFFGYKQLENGELVKRFTLFREEF